MKKCFDLIIFDCDGVLVDSERIANQVFADVLNKECGFSFGLDDMFEQFVGRSSIQCMELIEKLLGGKPPEDLEEKYKRAIDQALKTSVTSVMGIEKAISEIELPYCVASSGSYEKMNTTLGKTDLHKFFKGKLYSTSDVDRGKPYPDIYHHAAISMGVIKPERCLVVEDSPIGVKGAVAADMTVFGYSELMSKERLMYAGAHHVFNNMGELANEIKEYCKKGI